MRDADNEAKRRRLGPWNGYPGLVKNEPIDVDLGPGPLPLRAECQRSTAWAPGQSPDPLASFSSPQTTSPLPSHSPSSTNFDITARIVDALKCHLPGEDGPDALAHVGANAASHIDSRFSSQTCLTAGTEPELSARLLDSLRTLSANEVGQELFQVVQHMAPPQSHSVHGEMLALPMPQTVPTSQPSISSSLEVRRPVVLDAEDLAGEEGEPIRLPPVNFSALPPISPREDDVESDDGVPHRLPPGFGAIPEDIVEERARQREEERVLRLKATQPCRFGRRCKRRDCPNAHPEGRDIDTSLNPCAFGRRCKRKGCFYDHPEGRVIDDDPAKGMCKFGKRCSRPDCLYDHPDGRAPLAGPDPRICYFCHDSGHIATDCNRNPDSWNYNREAGAVEALPPSEEQKAIADPV